MTKRIKPWLPQIVDKGVLSLIKISDDEDLQVRLRALCNKYKNIFCNELPGAPAKVPKFSLTVQTEKCEVPRNRAPPCSQSTVKQTALFSTIETLLRQVSSRSQMFHTIVKFY